jgi:hypothetical protein
MLVLLLAGGGGLAALFFTCLCGGVLMLDSTAQPGPYPAEQGQYPVQQGPYAPAGAMGGPHGNPNGGVDIEKEMRDSDMRAKQWQDIQQGTPNPPGFKPY